MHWFQKLVLIVVILVSNICMYFWGRRDGFNSCYQIICEFLLEKMKESKEDV